MAVTRELAQREMRANERQVGGSHYKNGDGDQHWDVIDRFSIPYLEGVASKYPLRWREKGGIEDLEKTLHYIDKILESPDDHPRWDRHWMTFPGLASAIHMLCIAHKVNAIERDLIWSLLRGVQRSELIRQRDALSNYIEDLKQKRAGTPEDGGHHARTTEQITVDHRHVHVALPEGSSGNLKMAGDVLHVDWTS